jgi:hypothetical protein
MINFWFSPFSCRVSRQPGLWRNQVGGHFVQLQIATYIPLAQDCPMKRMIFHPVWTWVSLGQGSHSVGKWKGDNDFACCVQEAETIYENILIITRSSCFTFCRPKLLQILSPCVSSAPPPPISVAACPPYTVHSPSSCLSWERGQLAWRGGQQQRVGGGGNRYRESGAA